MKLTPLRQQYLDIKKRYPNIIVFFRLGDFYETFDRDAEIVARELEITLTAREMGKGNKVPLAGIPYHAIDNYLPKMIHKGYKIAICEQLTPPGKGLVERDVVRIITPGTVIEPSLLKETNNNYLCSVIMHGDQAGIAYIDITTCEFYTTQLPAIKARDEILRINPSELIVIEKVIPDWINTRITVTEVSGSNFEFSNAYEVLKNHFKVSSLEGYGCEHMPLAIRAAGAIIQYVLDTQIAISLNLQQLSTYSVDNFMTIDLQTRNNLELFTNLKTGTTANSLLSVIDLTRTPMGGRLLKKWFGQPLLNLDLINYRQICVQAFCEDNILREKLIAIIASIIDLERLINRVKSFAAIPRELLSLASSLKQIPKIKALLDNTILTDILHFNLRPCNEVVNLIDQSMNQNIQVQSDQDSIIKPGFSDELDNVYKLVTEAKLYLKNLETNERKRTGIKSLKVLYNKIFGYFIEVSKANLDLVPENYIRKQTLVNSERYFTPELKEYELTILTAEEKINDLQNAIFRQICNQIAESDNSVLQSAQAIAEIDVLTSLAEVAVRYKYVRPEVNHSNIISIKDGRHPVVERTMGMDRFVPNDTEMNNENTMIIILTGPNMSGKSTYLKQVALIILLAQIGSFVPAGAASIGIVDRIFTRIGAQEDLAAGQSTFMVEMMETANILNSATSKSLVILDEVGRGTSTYDGMSIAWAIVEYIHNNPGLKAKTLFATHYHELIDLAGSLPNVKNYNISVKDENGNITFLHRIIPGGADKSYGIHVAHLAGIPATVISRAEELLKTMEKNKGLKQANRESKISQQLNLFESGNILIEEIAKMDIDSVTPLEAITKLYYLKKRAAGAKLARD